MKIVLISEYNIFSSIGGTESYVDMLIKGLIERRHDVVLITKGKQKDEIISTYYSHNQFQYKCIFLAHVNFTKPEIEQREVSSSWHQILPVLMQEIPDVIHVHTYTTFFNIHHFEKCKERFTNIFFTSHIPAHFCPQGDLIKFYKKPCDGLLYNRCSVCLFFKSFKDGLGNLLHSYWKKVLRRLQKLNSLGVKLICVSDWQKQHAIRNGFPKDRIYIIRQAIVIQNYKPVESKDVKREFTIGFLGRLSPEKGASFLLQVITKLLLSSSFTFVLGIPLENCNPYFVSLLRSLCAEAGGRITILENVNASNKDFFFKGIDCLFIPSFFLETGPIVLLEALLYNKTVVVPDVGGPLEFQREFSENLTLYHWNQLHSAVQSLEFVSKKPKGGFDNHARLKEKENLFIRLHEEIYCESIYSQPVPTTA